MHRLAFPIILSLFLAQSAPVTPAPFGVFQPPGPVILNGCTENALFAVLNTSAGKECLSYLSRASNVSSSFSVFCKAGRWGCCDKASGYPNCKIEDAIPYRRAQPPAAMP